MDKVKVFQLVDDSTNIPIIAVKLSEFKNRSELQQFDRAGYWGLKKDYVLISSLEHQSRLTGDMTRLAVDIGYGDFGPLFKLKRYVAENWHILEKGQVIDLRTL